MVTDGGDNNDWDHADWIEPMLYNDKDSLLLTSLKWVKATAGWESPKLNKAVGGNALMSTVKNMIEG